MISGCVCVIRAHYPCSFDSETRVHVFAAHFRLDVMHMPGCFRCVEIGRVDVRACIVRLGRSRECDSDGNRHKQADMPTCMCVRTYMRTRVHLSRFVSAVMIMST